ncbi:MAG: bactofilin family protein [Solitalea-like symbiont of Acarus siro]
MFSPKKKVDNYNSQINDYSLTLIGSGTFIAGEIKCKNDIRIDGHIKGDISSENRVLIGENGIIEGNIYCQNAEISGCIIGNIKVKDNIVLKTNCKIQGDIQTKTIIIESGAVFAGNCQMETKDLFLLNESTDSLKKEKEPVEKTRT